MRECARGQLLMHNLEPNRFSSTLVLRSSTRRRMHVMACQLFVGTCPAPANHRLPVKRDRFISRLSKNDARGLSTRIFQANKLRQSECVHPSSQ